jgi:hypothetical protein
MITEKDTKGKISVEEQENKMNEKLKLNCNGKNNLLLNDLSSNYKNTFKTTRYSEKQNYTLIVYNAKLV